MEKTVEGRQRDQKLSSVLRDLGKSINLQPEVWLVADVAELSVSKGHTYLELVEYGKNNEVLAKTRGIIWKSRKHLILAFEQRTNQHFSKGLQILIKVKATFHPVFGLSLDITAINADFTIGSMAIKVGQIRELLTKNRLIDRNKQLKNPFDFFRIALVAPKGAAGLDDVLSELKRLGDCALLEWHLFHCDFQNDGAATQIKNTLKRISLQFGKEKSLDAICICRGGGATTDLEFLNDYELAASICNIDIPVLVGIGHRKDSTILDEVANTSFPTPSLLASHITKTVANNASATMKLWGDLTKHCQLRLIEKSQELEIVSNNIHSSLLTYTSASENRLVKGLTSLRLAALKKLSDESHELNTRKNTTREMLLFRLSENLKTVEQLGGILRVELLGRISKEKEQLELRKLNIDNLYDNLVRAERNYKRERAHRTLIISLVLIVIAMLIYILVR